MPTPREGAASAMRSPCCWPTSRPSTQVAAAYLRLLLQASTWSATRPGDGRRRLDAAWSGGHRPARAAYATLGAGSPSFHRPALARLDLSALSTTRTRRLLARRRRLGRPRRLHHVADLLRSDERGCPEAIKVLDGVIGDQQDTPTGGCSICAASPMSASTCWPEARSTCRPRSSRRPDEPGTAELSGLFLIDRGEHLQEVWPWSRRPPKPRPALRLPWSTAWAGPTAWATTSRRCSGWKEVVEEAAIRRSTTTWATPGVGRKEEAAVPAVFILTLAGRQDQGQRRGQVGLAWARRPDAQARRKLIP